MKTILRSLSVAFLILLSPSAWAALSIYALTTDNRLLIVDATVPQNVLGVVAITGLDPGDNVLGIDVRPANGLLYAISDGNDLYTINPATGAAAKVAALAADPGDLTDPFVALTGTATTRFSIDFNPVVDRLRVVNELEQNLRINPNNGLVTTDTPLAYAAGDPNQGVNPNLGGIAYINNVAGATATSLFGIDDQAFRIVLQNPPNNGTLASGATFGVTNATHVGLDVAPDGTVYVAGRHSVPNTPVEYILATVDLATGGGASHGPIGDGTIAIRDIAVAPTVSFSAPLYAISESGGSATITVNREGFLNTAITVQYSTFSDTASAASDYTTASGILSFGPAEATKTFEVPIINDPFPEEDEFVGLYLWNVTGPAVLGSPSIAALRINANDRPDVVGPQIEFIGLTGPSRGISGAVVHFNEDLNPASATDLANYKLTVVPKRGRSQVKMFTSAIYDPANRRVTLGLAPFMQTEFKTMALRVNGKAGGVTDLAGNLLDGNRDHRPGGDALQIFKVFSGATIKFTDRDGDRVTLELTGLGPDSRLDGVLPLGGPAGQTTQFWIVAPIALQTTFRGTVTRSTRGDGIVVISEIIGLDKKEFTPIITNPSFSINRLTFSSNATGLGVR